MKGQMGILISGLMGIFISLVVYLLAIHPVLGPIIDDFTAGLNSSDEGDALLITVVPLVPFFMLLAIVLSLINFVNPGQRFDTQG